VLLRSLGCAVAVVAAAACSATLGVASSGAGLRGLVTKGPTQPVCMAEKPCSAPAAGVKLFFSRKTDTKSVVTDAHGRYSIRLRPGLYQVEIKGAKFGVRPRSVSVPVGAFKTVNFTIDTGIR
jgi:Carboxypeptidase regulatory-like domain